MFECPAAKLRQRVTKYAGQQGGFRSLNADQCAQIMRWVRRVIEQEGKACFPYAKMYADWMQHNNLNNPFVLNTIIDRINEWFSEDRPVDMIVPKAIGLAELRQDLLRLFEKFQVPDDLLQTASIWMRFGGLLLEEIAGFPAGFPMPPEARKGEARKVLDRILARSVQRFGDPGESRPLWFGQLTIEPQQDEEGHFLWRLEFEFPDGSRWGCRGVVLLLDPQPFRVDDLGLRYGASVGEKLQALDHAYSKSICAGRLVPVSDRCTASSRSPVDP